MTNGPGGPDFLTTDPTAASAKGASIGGRFSSEGDEELSFLKIWKGRRVTFSVPSLNGRFG